MSMDFFGPPGPARTWELPGAELATKLERSKAAVVPQFYFWRERQPLLGTYDSNQSKSGSAWVSVPISVQGSRRNRFRRCGIVVTLNFAGSSFADSSSQSSGVATGAPARERVE